MSPVSTEGALSGFFQLQQHNTNVRTELMAGLTTFVTMAYIIFVNPQMMASAGMDHGAAFVATCLGAALACFIMGVYANWPVGLAPGMGLNAFFTYTVVADMGYSWQIALGAVFIAGILFVIMSVTRIRGWMLESIPLDMRIAMAAGVGLFIGFIGLKNAGIVVANPSTLITLGDLTQPGPMLGAIGFLVMAVLSQRQVHGAIIIGVLGVTLAGVPFGLVEYQGIIAVPPSLAPTFMQLDIVGAMDVAMVSVIIAFLFVNLFDTAGTLLGVAIRANLVDADGKIKNMDRALKADSTASVLGAFLGCAPVTSYVESAAGVAAGGRTGLTAVTVGALFVLAIFFSPLAGMVPAYATAGALVYVAMLMMTGMEKLDWADMSEVVPALLMIVMIPLTFSIANGIAVGFISYVVIKFCVGRRADITPGAYVLALIFLLKFAYL
jgi:AGZA family xanthine/uracil permease-like MFS transporter